MVEPVTRLLPELASPRVLRRMVGPLDDTVPAEREITVRDLVVIVLTQRVWEAAQPPAVHTDLQDAAYGARRAED